MRRQVTRKGDSHVVSIEGETRKHETRDSPPFLIMGKNLRQFDKTALRSYNVVMNELRFAWDPKKARANMDKHGVSVEKARSVFYDEHAVEFYDDEHSGWEDRFLLLGKSPRQRVLLVCHCYREEESVIRIVSARRATATERKLYPG